MDYERPMRPHQRSSMSALSNKKEKKDYKNAHSSAKAFSSPDRKSKNHRNEAVKADFVAKNAYEEQEHSHSERIAKRLARAGIASRREAESIIACGRVAVNGHVITSPARNVVRTDVITVDGRPLPTIERTRLWLYHKPAGLVTTHHDPEGRPTVFENLPEAMPRVLSVGRLDINTEGLLLLTNDGGLARVLELPSTAWTRRYRVRAFGHVTQEQLDTLKNGSVIDGIFYGAVEAQIERKQGSNIWIQLALREGKNREIKNILGSLGLVVNRLIRLSFGPFQLANLAEGAVQELKGRFLREQLGERLIEQAHADFEGPIINPVPRKSTGEEVQKMPIRKKGAWIASDVAKDYGAVRHKGAKKNRYEERGDIAFAAKAQGKEALSFSDKKDFSRSKQDLYQKERPNKGAFSSKPGLSRREEASSKKGFEKAAKGKEKTTNTEASFCPREVRKVNVWMAQGARPQGLSFKKKNAFSETSAPFAKIGKGSEKQRRSHAPSEGRAAGADYKKFSSQKSSKGSFSADKFSAGKKEAAGAFHAEKKKPFSKKKNFGDFKQSFRKEGSDSRKEGRAGKKAVMQSQNRSKQASSFQRRRRDAIK